MSDAKSAAAVIAVGIVDQIIIERYLINDLPKSNRFDTKKINKLTDYNYYRLRNYIISELYTISKKYIIITENKSLLAKKANEYIERLIKKAVFPAKYENNELIFNVLKLFDNSYFSNEEKTFIDYIVNEFLTIVNFNVNTINISIKNLIGFNNLNRPPFICNAIKVYNGILQKRLHAGDNIAEYIKIDLTPNEYSQILDYSNIFNCFYDKNGILQCDLDKNKNMLILNFLNTILYMFYDVSSKLVLLNKLNSKYPFLKSDNIL